MTNEAYEEAFAKVEIIAPYVMYNISYINQVYLMFRARLKDRDFRPGYESSEVKLFAEGEIPWREIAFRVIDKTLRKYFKDRPSRQFSFYIGDILPNQPY